MERMFRSFESHPEIVELISSTRVAAGGAPFCSPAMADRDAVSRLAEWAGRPAIGVERLRLALGTFWAVKGTAARLSWMTDEDPGRWLGTVAPKAPRKGQHIPAKPNDQYRTDTTDLERVLGGANE